MRYLHPELIPDQFRFGEILALKAAGIGRVRPYFEADTAALSLTQAIDNRALALKAAGKPIQLMWSGGIDSTLAAAALIRNGVDFSYLMTPSSIAEYPAFYADVIEPGSRPVVMVTNPADYFCSHYQAGSVVLFGEYDLLCATKYGATGYLWHGTPWRDRFSAEQVAVIEQELAGFPRQINTYLELYVWNREFARQYFSGVYYNQVSDWGRAVPFLDSMEIDRAIIEGDQYWQPSKVYKQYAKDYIGLVYPDPVYYKRKGKTHSLAGRAVPRDQVPKGVADDGALLLTEQEALSHAGFA